jgi:septal ring factor EnvC (AmiA/AmiB activator)
MCDKPGSGKPGQTGKPNPQKIGELGERQNQLNRETQSISQRLTRQMQLSTGDQAEMRRLAEEQARIREELESVQRDEDRQHQLLGRLDQAQKEMKEVEESLQSGQSLDQLEEKQSRILSRLLDAQRSMNRQDFEPQRESRPGEDIARSSPAELPAELMRENDRLRLDLLKADVDRYPAQYRALVEDYLRTLNGSHR